MKTKFILFALLIYGTNIWAQRQKIEIPDKQAQQQILNQHNTLRAEVGVSALTWSDKLAQSAAKWAKELAQNCDLEHSDNNYGENLFWSSYPSTGEDATLSWAKEKPDYNYASNTCKTDKVCGHYTQIIWKNTTQIGCAMVKCSSGYIWVCQYDPPGNWVGQKPY